MVQGRWPRLFLFCVLSISSGMPACLKSSQCGSGEIVPAEGAATDFHVQPASYDGFEVAAPLNCTAVRTVLEVKGLGTQVFWTLGEPCRNPGGFDASGLDSCGPTLRGVLDQALHRLWAERAYTAQIGWSAPQAACDSGLVLPAEYLHLERWQEADAAVGYLGEALRERNLGESVTVIVEPVIINCAM